MDWMETKQKFEEEYEVKFHDAIEVKQCLPATKMRTELSFRKFGDKIEK